MDADDDDDDWSVLWRTKSDCDDRLVMKEDTFLLISAKNFVPTRRQPPTEILNVDQGALCM